MIRKELTVVRSWLFQNEPENEELQIIDMVLGCHDTHPLTLIGIEFSPDTVKVIERVKKTKYYNMIMEQHDKKVTTKTKRK